MILAEEENQNSSVEIGEDYDYFNQQGSSIDASLQMDWDLNGLNWDEDEDMVGEDIVQSTL